MTSDVNTPLQPVVWVCSASSQWCSHTSERLWPLQTEVWLHPRCSSDNCPVTSSSECPEPWGWASPLDREFYSWRHKDKHFMLLWHCITSQHTEQSNTSSSSSSSWCTSASLSSSSWLLYLLRSSSKWLMSLIQISTSLVSEALDWISVFNRVRFVCWNNSEICVKSQWHPCLSYDTLTYQTFRDVEENVEGIQAMTDVLPEGCDGHHRFSVAPRQIIIIITWKQANQRKQRCWSFYDHFSDQSRLLCHLSHVCVNISSSSTHLQMMCRLMCECVM